jgi:hypothetical protein
MAPTWDECFDLVDWNRLEAEATSKDCLGYENTVRNWLAVEHNPNRKQALEVLSAVLALQVGWNGDVEEPLSPFGLVTAFPREALVSLAERAKNLPQPVLRARILDAAWMHHRACHASVALLAVDAYIEVAEAEHDPQRWPDSYAHLQRGVRLGVSLGRTQPATTKALDKAFEMLTAAAPTDPFYFSLRVIQLLLENKHGSPESLGRIAEDIGKRVVAAGDGDRARSYYEAAATCFQRARDEESSKRCLDAVASSLEADASVSDPMRRVMLLQQAIGARRQIGGQAPEVERLRVELQTAQTEMVSTFKPVSGPLDLSELARQAKRRVGGKSPFDAIIALAVIDMPPDVQQLREAALAILKDSPFRAFISHEKLSKAGRVLHKDAGVLAGDGEDAVTARTYEQAVLRMLVAARGAIRPAAQVVLDEHGFTGEDFYFLAWRSPFVPNGREAAFAKGLTTGLYGDHFTAAHLLIPQLENAVRVALTDLGAVTSTLPSSGIQNELDLNALLDKPEAEQFFGRNMLFMLRALLTEKAGANLRNELAHGLIDDGASSDLFVYAWWTVFHLVVASALHGAVPAETSKETANESTQPDGSG